jgi:hypothetical protein
MKLRQSSVWLVLGLLCCGAVAQDRGEWQPASKTAESITGVVAFGDEKMSINLASFPIAQIRPLTPAEAAAIFSVEPDAAGRGDLYRLEIPGAKKFAHKNTLCGSEETDWMTTYTSGRTLQLAFFSGLKMPVFTPEALANTTSLCGTFTYSR